MGEVLVQYCVLMCYGQAITAHRPLTYLTDVTQFPPLQHQLPAAHRPDRSYHRSIDDQQMFALQPSTTASLEGGGSIFSLVRAGRQALIRGSVGSIH